MSQTMSTGVASTGSATHPRSDSVWPRVDIYEAEDAFLLVADLPGANAENIDVQLDGDTLTLSALRDGRGDAEPMHRELIHRDYQRRFRVNAEIDAEAVSASFKDGVLHLRLPKAAAVRPRRITVTPEG